MTGRYQVHPCQIQAWKQALTAGAAGVFSNGQEQKNKSDASLIARLYQEIEKGEKRMARIRVTYQCGCDDRVIAPQRQAEWLRSRAAEKVCFQCQHDIENRQSMLAAQRVGLPTLTGTSIRQMEFGETCRVKVLDALGDLQQHGAVEDGLLLRVTLESSEEQQLFRDILDWMRTQTCAGWWADLWDLYRRHPMTGQRKAIISQVMAELRWCQDCFQKGVPGRRVIAGSLGYRCNDCWERGEVAVGDEEPGE